MEEDFTLQQLYKQNKIQQRRIKNLEAVIAAQNQTIMNQSAGCEERHNVICGVKEVIDEYFGDA